MTISQLIGAPVSSAVACRSAAAASIHGVALIRISNDSAPWSACVRSAVWKGWLDRFAAAEPGQDLDREVPRGGEGLGGGLRRGLRSRVVLGRQRRR